jgi:hypothetical protein
MSLEGRGIDSDLRNTFFVAYRGLTFQGDNTKIVDVNNDNLLDILELLGRYDEITREHLAKVRIHLEGETIKGKSTIYRGWAITCLLPCVVTNC